MRTLLLILTLVMISFQSEQLPKIPITWKDLPVVKNDAFKRGEVLTFRVHYGVIDAGLASLTITEEAVDFGGRKTMHIVGTGTSQGALDWFFKVRDRYETYLDELSIVPWYFVRDIREGSYSCKQNYIFNHYTEKVDVGNKQIYDSGPNMQDMISAFYHVRTMNLSDAKPGDIFCVNSFVDKEIFQVNIKFISREVITTSLGTFKCLKFRPIIQKGRVFKNEDDLNIWLTDDKNHIPIMGQANILVGSVKMELTGYSGLVNEISKIK